MSLDIGSIGLLNIPKRQILCYMSSAKSKSSHIYLHQRVLEVYVLFDPSPVKDSAPVSASLHVYRPYLWTTLRALPLYMTFPVSRRMARRHSRPCRLPRSAVSAVNACTCPRGRTLTVISSIARASIVSSVTPPSGPTASTPRRTERAKV